MPGCAKPDRSIPACAGEPSPMVMSTVARSVYPRVCGGTGPARNGGRLRYGLSPRVRGNPSLDGDPQVVRRSIPACAGEPRPVRFLPHEFQVYPRVCGGTPRQFGSTSKLRGLSPRVRGNPAGAECYPLPIGSIPACAGEPPICPAARMTAGVYPRVCGGTMRRGSQSKSIPGLSPRVRGNPIKPSSQS